MRMGNRRLRSHDWRPRGKPSLYIHLETRTLASRRRKGANGAISSGIPQRFGPGGYWLEAWLLSMVLWLGTTMYGDQLMFVLYFRGWNHIKIHWMLVRQGTHLGSGLSFSSPWPWFPYATSQRRSVQSFNPSSDPFQTDHRSDITGCRILRKARRKGLCWLEITPK